ncbi:putative g protein-coupled receptor protein [Botryosphaeria dothidea]|uniref:G protein-coupled receptor protein n=1 Tax=Botryosphaeria dothidea TaxID=55169 RepID=A0A8H4ITQ5_9PEZI|nr:putative g protein-coupled receptor protein [Botryosphaeria dothidea]
MWPSADDCDDCVPDYMRHSASTTFFSCLPFIATFLVAALAVHHRLFPLLSGSSKASDALHSPTAAVAFREPWKRRFGAPSGERVAGLVFSTNVALSAVLVELILCEISNSLNQAARSLALKITLSLLLVLLILVTPALEIHSVLSAGGWSFTEHGKGRIRIAWLMEGIGMSLWLLGFWWLGEGLLGSYLHEKSYVNKHSFSEGCLERIGVIGVSLMASLAGFAAVSSLWQNFGVKQKMITEADIARKQAGLDATNDMLQVKQSRLRAVQRRISETPQEGFMTRVIGTIRGNTEMQERQSLQLEISGLETMAAGLSNSLLAMQARRQAQLRSKTAVGHLLNLFSYAFSIYCLYRIGATTLTTFRRLHAPETSFSNSDPINNILALLAKHWDPSLDRAAWSRQISFLLAGVMLLASFNSVLQTFLLFTRLAPSLLQHAQSNIALIVSQISATYVISSALLLRSNLPPEYRGVISEALGAPLEPGFVERWFEGWFLAACAVSGLGIWLGRKVRLGGDWVDMDDDYAEADVEMGKMS